MLNLLAAGATYVFPGLLASKLVKNAISIINSTNSLILTKNITMVVVDCCTLPPHRLAYYCLVGSASIGTSILSLNPVTIVSAIYIITEIYDNY